MKITTSSGFTCDFDVEALNDWELHEILLDDEDQLKESRFTSAVMKKCMSKEDAKALKDHVKTRDGRVQADMLKVEVMDIINGIGAKGKNSVASSGT